MGFREGIARVHGPKNRETNAKQQWGGGWGEKKWGKKCTTCAYEGQKSFPLGAPVTGPRWD